MVFERYIKNYTAEFNKLDRDVWNYEDGCFLTGAWRMYEATGEECYYGCIENYINRYVDEEGVIKGYNPNEYNIDRIPPGLVLYLLYDRKGEKKYRKAIEALQNQLRNQPRTANGSFWHKKIYPYQIWLDGLYMGMPFYLTYMKLFEKEKEYGDIIKQFNNTRAVLFDEEKRLYYHAYDEKKQMFWADKETGLSENHWSRAMGWYIMALVDCYEIFPEEETEARKRLGELLTEAVDGLVLYQDQGSGLFYQLTALAKVPGNYLETSASAMIAYTIMKGIRLGILDEQRYRGKGEEILIGIETRMFSLSQGKLKLNGMCKGAGLGPDDRSNRDGSVAYYLSEEVVSDEQKGVGAVMMAYSQWILLIKEKPLAAADRPEVQIWNGSY